MNTDVPEDPREIVEGFEMVAEHGITRDQRVAYRNAAVELQAWIEEHYIGIQEEHVNDDLALDIELDPDDFLDTGGDVR